MRFLLLASLLTGCATQRDFDRQKKADLEFSRATIGAVTALIESMTDHEKRLQDLEYNAALNVQDPQAARRQKFHEASRRAAEKTK